MLQHALREAQRFSRVITHRRPAGRQNWLLACQRNPLPLSDALSSESGNQEGNQKTETNINDLRRSSDTQIASKDGENLEAVSSQNSSKTSNGSPLRSQTDPVEKIRREPKSLNPARRRAIGLVNLSKGPQFVEPSMSRPLLESKSGWSKTLVYVSLSDGDALAVHEQNPLSERTQNYPESLWISDEELLSVLPVAIPYPHPHRGPPRILIPLTSDDLVERLMQALHFRPPLSLKRLCDFHNTYTQLQSTASYKILIRLAIRATHYRLADRLFLRMISRGISFDTEAKALYIRTMVRSGKWLHAQEYVRKELQPMNRSVNLDLMIELLDRANLRAFRKRNTDMPVDTSFRESGRSSASNSRLEPSANLFNSTSSSIMSIVASAEERTPFRIVFPLVRYSLRSGNFNFARNLTKSWIDQLPSGHSTRRRALRCITLANLCLALSPKNTKEHFKCRRFIDALVTARRELRPNSSTLFLLLRSLERTRDATPLAIQLVHAYRKRWGRRVIDIRVCRRICSIALREKRTKVAQKWKDEGEAMLRARKALFAQSFVAGENSSYDYSNSQSIHSAMPGVYSEKRKWLILHKRFSRGRRKTDTGTRPETKVRTRRKM